MASADMNPSSAKRRTDGPTSFKKATAGAVAESSALTNLDAETCHLTVAAARLPMRKQARFGANHQDCHCLPRKAGLSAFVPPQKVVKAPRIMKRDSIFIPAGQC